jgi:hypothetical protein
MTTRTVTTDYRNMGPTLRRIAEADREAAIALGQSHPRDYRVIAWLKQLPPSGIGDLAFVPAAKEH